MIIPLMILDSIFRGAPERLKALFDAIRWFIHDRTPDEKITWSVQTYQDYDLLVRCLKRLRSVYPQSPIQVISDGDPNPKYLDLANKFDVLYISGERLFVVDRGGDLVQRLFKHFLEQPTDFLIKIDPDTNVIMRLSLLPSPTALGVYGSVIESEDGLRAVQGGCMIFPRATAEKMFDSKLFLSDELKPPKLAWVTAPLLRERALAKGLSSHDWTVAYVARELNIPMIIHPQVCSSWKVIRLMGMPRARIVHPCPNSLARACIKSALRSISSRINRAR